MERLNPCLLPQVKAEQPPGCFKAASEQRALATGYSPCAPTPMPGFGEWTAAPCQALCPLCGRMSPRSGSRCHPQAGTSDGRAGASTRQLLSRPCGLSAPEAGSCQICSVHAHMHTRPCAHAWPAHTHPRTHARSAYTCIHTHTCAHSAYACTHTPLCVHSACTHTHTSLACTCTHTPAPHECAHTSPLHTRAPLHTSYAPHVSFPRSQNPVPSLLGLSPAPCSPGTGFPQHRDNRLQPGGDQSPYWGELGGQDIGGGAAAAVPRAGAGRGGRHAAVRPALAQSSETSHETQHPPTSAGAGSHPPHP